MTEQLIYPEELTPALRDAIGIMIFESGPVAHLFRAAGHNIDCKVEAEQTFVLHWLIKLALQHGDGWKPITANELDRLKAIVREKKGKADDQPSSTG